MTRQQKIIVYASVSALSIGYLSYKAIRRNQIYNELIGVIEKTGGQYNKSKNESALKGTLHPIIESQNYDRGIIILQPLEVKNRAEALFSAIDGAGTDEEKIASVITMFNDKYALSQVASFYRAKYNETLYDALKGDLNNRDYEYYVTENMAKLPEVRFV